MELHQIMFDKMISDCIIYNNDGIFPVKGNGYSRITVNSLIRYASGYITLYYDFIDEEIKNLLISAYNRGCTIKVATTKIDNRHLESLESCGITVNRISEPMFSHYFCATDEMRYTLFDRKSLEGFFSSYNIKNYNKLLTIYKTHITLEQ